MFALSREERVEIFVTLSKPLGSDRGAQSPCNGEVTVMLEAPNLCSGVERNFFYD
jgi:hypothetical protein